MSVPTVSLQRRKNRINRVELAGEGVKECQGKREGYLCCNLKTISLIQNCPYDCSYCFLQFYLNSDETRVVESMEQVKEALLALSQKHPSQLFRVTTGELSDSLALEGIAGHLDELLPFVERLPNVVLELKTKSANIAPLLSRHFQHTFVSFSVNPDAFAREEERGAATPGERIAAAKKLKEAGYSLAFHFDPLVAFQGWEEEYEGLVEQLCAEISPDRVLYLSLGALRFRPSLYRRLLFHKPMSLIFSQELFLAEDGKLRYPIFLRNRLYRRLLGFLRKRWKEVPIYLCMEMREVWEGVMKDLPKESDEVEASLIASVRDKMLR